MADVFTKEKRSAVMSAIRASDTKPEIVVRKLLFASGFRFRLHSTRLPGKPDVVLPKWRVVVFVNGCFWHQHHGCRRATSPSSRAEYWLPKLRRNVERDAEEVASLCAAGWRVCIVWECACGRRSLEELQARLGDFIRSGRAYEEIGRDWNAAEPGALRSSLGLVT